MTSLIVACDLSSPWRTSTSPRAPRPPSSLSLRLTLLALLPTRVFGCLQKVPHTSLFHKPADDLRPCTLRFRVLLHCDAQLKPCRNASPPNDTGRCLGPYDAQRLDRMIIQTLEYHLFAPGVIGGFGKPASLKPAPVRCRSLSARGAGCEYGIQGTGHGILRE